MIESFKLPTITPETVSGSIVSFNDEYGGLPLKSCTSLISGYQEGSGTPSPSNVRNLVSFNSATLTENGNTHLFTFGQSIYSGYIDWKKGVVVGTHGIVDLGSLTWNYNAKRDYFTALINNIKLPTTVQERLEGIICEIYPPSSNGSYSDVDNQSMIHYDSYLAIKDTNYGNDSTAFNTAMNGVYLAYELATPIEIPLGGIQLLTQEGQNNIFCDTGDTEVKRLKVN